MKTLVHGAGYLIVDHRNSPGLTPADVAHIPGAIAVPGGQVLERDVLTCKHCERAVVLNPLRERPRGYCAHCHHYICDGCAEALATTGVCVPMAARLDQAQTIAEKYAGQPDHPDARPDIVLTDLT